MAMAKGRRGSRRASGVQYAFDEGQSVGRRQTRNSKRASSLVNFMRGRSSAASPGSLSQIEEQSETRTPGSPRQSLFESDLKGSFQGEATADSGATMLQNFHKESAPDRPHRPRAASAPASSRRSRHGERLKSKVEPIPVGNGEAAAGKMVRYDPAGFADSRGGTVMMGSIVKEDQEYDTQAAQLRERRLAGEKADSENPNVKFAGFTDRFIRRQDGWAMKQCLDHINGTWNAEHKPGCKCPVCAPLAASLMPPAGQVQQVEVGGAGKPPYVLQVECDGIMPQVDFLKISSAGRKAFKFRKEKAEEEIKNRRGTVLHARGCEPPEKPPDRLRMSEGVRHALNGEGIDPASDEGAFWFKAWWGHKAKASSIPGERVDEKAEGYNPVWNEQIFTPRPGRNYQNRIRATHHFEDGEICKTLHAGHGVVIGTKKTYRCPKKNGEYSSGFSEFTHSYNKHMEPMLRYEGPLCKGKRAVSMPPAAVDTVGVSEVVFNMPRRQQYAASAVRESDSPDAEDTSQCGTPGATNPERASSSTPRATPRGGDGTPRSTPRGRDGTPRVTPRGEDESITTLPSTPRGTPRPRKPVNDGAALLEGAAGLPTRSTNKFGLSLVEGFSHRTWSTEEKQLYSCTHHLTTEDARQAREHRLRHDDGFAKKTEEIATTSDAVRRLSKDIKHRLHHGQSRSVAAALNWDASR